MENPMSSEDILNESVTVVAEELEKKGFELVGRVENPLQMPQIQVQKGGVDVLVFVSASTVSAAPREVFESEQLEKFITFAHERESDCLVAIVYIRAQQPDRELQFGEPYMASVEYDLFPQLGL